MSDQQFGPPPVPPPPPVTSAGWHAVPPPPPVTPGSPVFQGYAPNIISAPVVPAMRRPDRAIGFGLVAALVAGVLWYGIVVISDRQFVYLAIGFGGLIGFAVVLGAGRAGVSTALISIVISAIGIVASYYFINRHAIVEELTREGGFQPVPLFGSFEQVKEIVRIGYREEPSQIFFSIVAVVAAGVMGSRNH